MKKRQYAIFTATILSISVILFSCGNKMKNTGNLTFDSIQINETSHLFGDTAKPACNLTINYSFPVKSSDKKLKDSLNHMLTALCFGDKYIGVPAKELIKQYTNEYISNYKHDLEPMYSEDQKEKKDDTPIEGWYSYYKNIEGHVQYYQKSLLIYRMDYNEYTGGAHGMYGTSYLNIDLTTLRPIHLDDIFTGDYSELLTDLLWNQLMADKHVTSHKELEDLGYASTGDLIPTENFYLTKEGIVFHYNVYEFTPYVMGTVDIQLPYEIMERIMVPDNRIINELMN